MPNKASHTYVAKRHSPKKTKKRRPPRRDSRLILTAASGHQLFYCVNNCLECLGLVHSEVSHNLAVEGDTLRVNLTHKL